MSFAGRARAVRHPWRCAHPFSSVVQAFVASQSYLALHACQIFIVIRDDAFVDTDAEFGVRARAVESPVEPGPAKAAPAHVEP